MAISDKEIERAIHNFSRAMGKWLDRIWFEEFAPDYVAQKNIEGTPEDEWPMKAIEKHLSELVVCTDCGAHVQNIDHLGPYLTTLCCDARCTIDPMDALERFSDPDVITELYREVVMKRIEEREKRWLQSTKE